MTHEVDIVEPSDDNEVTSETVHSHIYPDINDTVTPSAPEESTVENTETQSSDPEAITIRLKYLDDTERVVTSHPRVKIGEFKRYVPEGNFKFKLLIVFVKLFLD